MPQIVSPPKLQKLAQRPIITTCHHCNYAISYTEDEVERVSNDGVGVLCPNCEEPIVTEHIEPFTFPDTFYRFGMSEGAVCLDDNRVQELVDIVKCKLQQELKVGEYYYTGTGDTKVFGFKLEDGDEIIVAKNYWVDNVFKE